MHKAIIGFALFMSMGLSHFAGAAEATQEAADNSANYTDEVLLVTDDSQANWVNTENATEADSALIEQARFRVIRRCVHGRFGRVRCTIIRRW